MEWNRVLKQITLYNLYQKLKYEQKVPVQVGVQELIMNAPRITDHGSAV
jgi:hypothetical protein